MVNPQKEHGHIQLATGSGENDLIMALVRASLHGSEYQVALFVLRKTWGYGKKEDRISLSQFQKATGLARSTVCHAINTLVARRVLVAQRRLPITVYSFNKRFDEWVVAYMQLVAHTGLDLVAQTGVASSMDGTGVVAQLGHTKGDVTKETITKEKALEKNEIKKTNDERRQEIKQWTQEDIEKLEKDFMPFAVAYSDDAYAQKTWEQRLNLRADNRAEFYRKCVLFCGYCRGRSEKMQGKARVLFAEIAGHINDKGAMERKLDDQEIADRRNFAIEESGQKYVESELDGNSDIF